MKKIIILLLLAVVFSFAVSDAVAQCSICTRTAAQLGEKPAKGLNAGIIYLALTPITVVSIIALRWWRKNGSADSENETV